MQIIYHGHAFIEILSSSARILIDPFITNNPTCKTTMEEVVSGKFDAIVLTHGHGDHVGDTLTLAAHYPDACVISTSGVIARLQGQGMTNPVHKPSIGGILQLSHFSIKMTPAQHDARVMDSDIYSQPAGVIITVDDKKIYHAGDTGLISDLQLINQWGPIDVAFLPIGDYYTMGVEDAVIACSWIKPTTVVPIHYNTFAQIKSDPMEFARRVMLDKSAVPKVLLPGQYVVL